MMQLVCDYRNYTQNIKDLIDQSDYKVGFFIKLLNLSRATFYRKIKDNSWTVDEIYKISEKLYPKEAYLLEIKEGMQDYKNGSYVDVDKYLADLKSQYQ